LFLADLAANHFGSESKPLSHLQIHEHQETFQGRRRPSEVGSLIKVACHLVVAWSWRTVSFVLSKYELLTNDQKSTAPSCSWAIQSPTGRRLCSSNMPVHDLACCQTSAKTIPSINKELTRSWKQKRLLFSRWPDSPRCQPLFVKKPWLVREKHMNSKKTSRQACHPLFLSSQVYGKCASRLFSFCLSNLGVESV
jgi:hypothetical protein